MLYIIYHIPYIPSMIYYICYIISIHHISCHADLYFGQDGSRLSPWITRCQSTEANWDILAMWYCGYGRNMGPSVLIWTQIVEVFF